MTADELFLPRPRADLIVDRAEAGSDAATAVFNTTRTHRYVLTRRWADGPTAVIIGANPSVASARVTDPTTRRCVGLTARQGCGSMALLNLSALIATNPHQLTDHDDPTGPYNDEFLRHVTAGQQLVIAAWGIHGARSGRVDQVLANLHAAGVTLVCWGLTHAGAPRHPLYVRNDAPLVPYPPAASTGASVTSLDESSGVVTT